MKNFLILLVTLFSLNLSAQITRTREVYKGLYDYKITERTKDGDTTRSWHYHFDNSGAFIFHDKSSLKQFADDILLIAAEPKGGSALLERERYSLNRYDYAPNSVFFKDEFGRSRTMTVKQAKKFANHILQNAVSMMPTEFRY